MAFTLRILHELSMFLLIFVPFHLPAMGDAGVSQNSKRHRPVTWAWYRFWWLGRVGVGGGSHGVQMAAGGLLSFFIPAGSRDAAK